MAVQDRAKGFGASLRHERERRGIALAEVATATKIKPSYLEALEREDLAALPGTVFNKGYVRSYARYLDLPAGPLLEAYDAVEGERVRAGEIERPDLLEAMRSAVGVERTLAAASRWRLTPVGRRLLAGLAVVLLLAVVALFAFRLAAPARLPQARAAPAPPPQAPAVAEREPPPEPRPEPPPERTAPPPERTAPPPERTAPQAPSAETLPAPAPASGMSVAEHGLGTGIDNLELRQRVQRFRPGQRAWFWTRVGGGRRGEVMRHVWIHDGREVTTIELELGGSSWRTYSYKTMRPTMSGSWAVEARDPTGRVLAREAFTVGD